MSEQFAVWDNGWNVKVVQFIRRTDRTFSYVENGKERRASITGLRWITSTRADADRKVAQLTSAKAEHDKRCRAAREWLAAETARICRPQP